MTRILIVDDEESIRQLLRQMLATKGYHCILADDAAQARRHLREKPFELVISDMNMSTESGLDLLRHVALEYPWTATMLMSGSLDPEIVQKAREAGVDQYLPKPFQFHDLLAGVATALRKRPGNGRFQTGAQPARRTRKGASRNVQSGVSRRPVRNLPVARRSLCSPHLSGRAFL